MSETVTGYIDHVIFRNEDNGYTVMVLKGMEEGQELTCVGTFPAITQGVSIEASGNYTTHPVYGKQFQISSYVEKMPEDALAVERYLGSGAIKGIGAALAARIVRRFGDDTMRIVEEEQERLAEIKGISEKKAMEIAEQMTEKADMRRAMIFLQKYGISLNLGAKIYQKYGQSVYGVLQENPYRLAEDISGVGFRIADDIASRIGIHTDSDYRIRSGLLYTLLQASGEGHIYLPNAIIRYFEEEGAELRLAAPTGRAAKRMTEATGYEAQTIHRLLELNGMPEGEQEGRAVHFDRNFENPLEADVIIIDEMSMVDIALMHSLLLAITAGTRLILVGDENQLPSVGPGNVLRDIIRSGCFSVVELKKIFRQASESDIVVNAHKINRGEQVTINNKSRDFFFLKRYDADIIIRVVIALIQEKLPRYVDAKPYEIQVLTPMRKGLLGVERLNQILQRYLNPPDEKKKEKEIGQRLFREGDKVMQVKNNYQLEWEILGRYKIPVDKGVGVFNGDTGIMTEINEFAETATVEFEDGRQAQYSFKQLEELELAYAVTIHKSQGSEYPAVILPILSGPRMLMNRNLLYTAVTRARKCVTVVGSENTFAEMIRNEKQQQRYSSLDRRIRELDEAEIN